MLALLKCDLSWISEGDDLTRFSVLFFCRFWSINLFLIFGIFC
jgi:hypothetical protein